MNPSETYSKKQQLDLNDENLQFQGAKGRPYLRSYESVPAYSRSQQQYNRMMDYEEEAYGDKKAVDYEDNAQDYGDKKAVDYEDNDQAADGDQDGGQGDYDDQDNQDDGENDQDEDQGDQDDQDNQDDGDDDQGDGYDDDIKVREYRMPYIQVNCTPGRAVTGGRWVKQISEPVLQQCDQCGIIFSDDPSDDGIYY